MAEWTDPDLLTQFPGRARAADFNRVLDNLKLLGDLTVMTSEIATAGQRTSAFYGPLDDATGPEIEFRTGHSGVVAFTVQVQALVTPAGSNGYAAYEIRRLSNNQVVVSAQDWRAARWRHNLTAAYSFTHTEQLDPMTNYLIRMVYRTDATIQVLGRYIQVHDVLPVA